MTYVDRDQMLAALEEVLSRGHTAAYDLRNDIQAVLAALPVVEPVGAVQAAIEKLSGLPVQLDHEELDGLGNQVNDAITLLLPALPVLETKKETP